MGLLSSLLFKAACWVDLLERREWFGKRPPPKLELVAPVVTRIDVSEDVFERQTVATAGDFSIFRDSFPDQLRGLEHIEGSLFIRYNTQLTSLEDLQSLKSVQGSIVVYMNENLCDFAGLENLKSVGGNFAIVGNHALADVSALTSLTHIGGDLRVVGNPIMCYGPLVSFVPVGNVILHVDNEATYFASSLVKS